MGSRIEHALSPGPEASDRDERATEWARCTGLARTSPARVVWPPWKMRSQRERTQSGPHGPSRARNSLALHREEVASASMTSWNLFNSWLREVDSLRRLARG